MSDSSDDEGSDNDFNDGSKFHQTVKMLNMTRKDIVRINIDLLVRCSCRRIYNPVCYLSLTMKEKIGEVLRNA